MNLLIFQRLTIEFFIDIANFPVWWYSRGALRAANYSIDMVKQGNYRLAPGLWLRYIFVPMFGQNDWQGRIVSFFMRLANIIVRTGMIAVLCLFAFIIFLFWLAMPVVFVTMFIQSVG